ncbi:MAG: hypothetical protein J2P57_04905 [Acidimicrobiaceae bacterium]|nr:hypothetical protein [Acidimicrobiaceae bacterium]
MIWVGLGAGLVAVGLAFVVGYLTGVADERAARAVAEMRRSRRHHPTGRLRVYDGEEGA